MITVISAVIDGLIALACILVGAALLNLLWDKLD
jgi:hypothetical protein